MENQIVGSTLKFAGSQISNGNIFFDVNSIILLLIFISLLALAFSILAYVKYKRDKGNVPNGTTVDYLNKEIKYHSADLDAINQRLSIIEAKQQGIDALHKSILELKGIIQEGRNDG